MTVFGKSEANQGNIADAKALYQQSIEDYTATIKVDPEYSSAYNGRGWTKYILGQIENDHGNTEEAKGLFHAAVTDGDEAIRLNSDKSSANAEYHTRAVAKVALGDYDGAIEDFDTAIRNKPDDALYYYDRGQAKQALGKHEEAKADLTKAKELDPDVENKSF